MRRVGGDVRKERRVAILLLFNPAKRGCEKQVGAEALGFDERPIVPDDWIEILVARSIGATAFVRLPDAARAVDEGFVKPARVRLVRLLVTKMPLAKNTAGVAGLLEHLRKDGGLERHAFALEDGVGHTVFHRMPAGH